MPVMAVLTAEIHSFVAAQYRCWNHQLVPELRKQGMSMPAYRMNTKREILKYRVLNIAVGSKINVGDSEVQSYYDRHMKSANIQVRASHIFIAIPEDADNAALLDREKLAKSLLARVQSGEDFAKLAREYSQDAGTRAEGGDLGFIGRDILPKPMEELVFSMRVGDIRGPVRADRGFHVINKEPECLERGSSREDRGEARSCGGDSDRDNDDDRAPRQLVSSTT